MRDPGLPLMADLQPALDSRGPLLADALMSNKTRYHLGLSGPILCAKASSQIVTAWSETSLVTFALPLDPHGGIARSRPDFELALLGEDRKFQLWPFCPDCRKGWCEKQWNPERLRDRWRTFCECRDSGWQESRTGALTWWKMVLALEKTKPCTLCQRSCPLTLIIRPFHCGRTGGASACSIRGQ